MRDAHWGVPLFFKQLIQSGLIAEAIRDSSKHMKIRLLPYQADWPRAFEARSASIKRALGPLILEIEHIGSTSVPGLAAKPVIDMQMAVTDIDEFDKQGGVEKMASLGYEHNTSFLEMVPFRRLFSIKPTEQGLGVNIHTVAIDHPWWVRHLCFRDYLRQNQDARQRYEGEKMRLAQQEWSSTADYAGAKTEIIWQLEEEAFAWAKLPKERREFIRSGRI